MQCPRCQHENPPESNFCLGCGARLGLTCASCGADLPAGSRFCNKCAAPLAAAPTPIASASRFSSPESYTPKHLAERILTSKAALEGERKQVTVLFADLKGSMELLADRDPEDARKLLDPVLGHMMEAVHRYEVEQRVRTWLALPRDTMLSFFEPDPEYDVTALLPRVSVPTLVTWGTADRASSAEDAYLLTAGIPGAQLYEFHGRMHIPAITATEEFCEVLRQFGGTSAVAVPGTIDVPPRHGAELR